VKMCVSTSIEMKDAYEIFYSVFPGPENLVPILTGVMSNVLSSMVVAS
jgi:hypothetical protein